MNASATSRGPLSEYHPGEYFCEMFGRRGLAHTKTIRERLDGLDGATNLLHQLPKPSRYPEIETEGLSTMPSAVARSETRVKWIFSIKITGVDCGKSYCNS